MRLFAGNLYHIQPANCQDHPAFSVTSDNLRYRPWPYFDCRSAQAGTFSTKFNHSLLKEKPSEFGAGRPIAQHYTNVKKGFYQLITKPLQS
jgi:hypothetical protein